MIKPGHEVETEYVFYPPDGLWPPDEINTKRDYFPNELEPIEEEGLGLAMSNGNIDNADIEGEPLPDSPDKSPNRRYFLRNKPGRNGWTKVPDRHTRAEKYLPKPRRERMAREGLPIPEPYTLQSAPNGNFVNLDQIAFDLDMQRRTVSILAGRLLARKLK